MFTTERELQSLWPASAGLRLETIGGAVVDVVYPGIRAGSAGPDYKCAVVSFGAGRLAWGDVELHLRGADWIRHGHHRDHEYDHVILHVVAQPNDTPLVHLASGQEVPTAVLHRQVTIGRHSSLPCSHGASQGVESRLEVLARAGVARMLARAGKIISSRYALDPSRALVLRTARALGYSANAETAESLGERLTRPDVAALLAGYDSLRRGALLLGFAGLLPSQRRRVGIAVAGEAPEYEAVWMEHQAIAPPLEPGAWRLHGLYPNNSPVRRVVALAELWPSLWAPTERMHWLLDVNDIAKDNDAALLERRFRVRGDDYWRHHSDFGVSTREADLIGGSKAREVVVNALLPCAAAMAMQRGEVELLSRIACILASYPPAPMHAVTRHMVDQLGLGRTRLTSAIQQGLLHLFSEHCRHGLCRSCPLGSAGGTDSSISDQYEAAVNLGW